MSQTTFSLIGGRIFSLAILLIFFLMLAIFEILAKRGKMAVALKKIPAIDAIPEGVGRAVEVGRPIHVAIEGAGLESDEAPTTVACYTLTRYIAQQVAEKGANLIVSASGADHLPLAEQNVLEGFRTAGHPEMFKPGVILYAPRGFTYYTHCMGVIERERVATSVIIGTISSGPALIFTEVGARIGAMQIGGSVQPINLPVLAATVDYCMLGEELLVSGAYLYKDPLQIATIRSEDLIKVIGAVMGVAGVLLSLAGIPLIASILKL